MKDNDAGPIATAKISLDAAVKIAEKHVSGKAVRAEYEKQRDGRWVYDVEVKANAAVSDVKVDPENGTVIASKLDQADNDDEADRAD
ncbi:PepSY domain-containing protein [Bradyrhizobium diazoefficiens]